VPLLYAIHGKTGLQAFALGFLTGLISYLGILYWIIVAVHTYGNIPLLVSAFILLLLVGYLSLFTGTFAFLTRVVPWSSGIQALLFLPILWTALEYLRSFLLTGFPWANLGYSQYLNLPFIQMADMTGPYGLSFVILLVNAALFWALHQWARKTFPVREVVVTLIVLLASMIYGYVKIGMVDQQMLEQEGH
jgi:apolipoprotein N-acyltransferase